MWQEDWVRLNGLADLAAEKGLAGHALGKEALEKVALVDSTAKAALSHMAATVCRDAARGAKARKERRAFTALRPKPQPKAKGRPRIEMTEGLTARGHMVAKHWAGDSQGWKCARCGRTAFARASIAQLRCSRCPGAT